MPLLRAFDNAAYRPEYSTFLVQDIPRPDRGAPRCGALLARYAVDAQPCGSVARAGEGWLDGVASSDHCHAVRIEVHDAPPGEEDLSGWEEVVETPFATSGVVGLARVVGGPTGEQVELGAPGLYRVRFACRPKVAGDTVGGSSCVYLLRFWPVDAPVEPPRWLRRTRPLAGGRAGGRDAFDGAYRCAVSDVVMLVLWAAESATPVTLRWLADRLSTTTATVRGIIERPVADGVLSVDGGLEDADAPLAATVHPRQPARPRTGRAVPVPGIRPRPSVRASPGLRPSAAGTSSAAARPKAGRPALPRQGAPGTPEHPGGDPDPGRAG